MKVFKKLSELLFEKFEIKGTVDNVESFIMKYFDESTTVYGSFKIFYEMHNELEKYYLANEKQEKTYE